MESTQSPSTPESNIALKEFLKNVDKLRECFDCFIDSAKSSKKPSFRENFSELSTVRNYLRSEFYTMEEKAHKIEDKPSSYVYVFKFIIPGVEKDPTITMYEWVDNKPFKGKKKGEYIMNKSVITGCDKMLKELSQ